MEFWLFLMTLVVLIAEVLLLLIVLDFDSKAKLPPALTLIIKKFNRKLVQYPDSSAGIATRPHDGYHPKNSGHKNKESLNQAEQKKTHGYDTSNNEFKSTLTLGKRAQHPPGSNLNLQCFPCAPVSKGFAGCAIHKGSIVGCATFFEHENYEYKLLCRGELYFRPKGALAFRDGFIAPKEPGRLFIVRLDNTGSNVVAFCFEPSSRTLGEVNGRAEFLPVQTSIASSQEAHGLVYTQGQGCVFDWVYGNRSSSQYPWDYNIRYDVGWLHSSPATEELFASNDELLVECCPPFANSQNPLGRSLEGFDSIESCHSPDTVGELQVGFARIESNTTTQQTNDAQPTLPFPLVPTAQSGAPSSARVISKSVLRRTCTICERVLRRPSALIIHMNAHLGVKPFQCGDCDYASTNVTNLERHQETKHGKVRAQTLLLPM
ncbi:unnamed protein product [Rhizoctonia solani]|uniref:C2H2-type domain-containing protein n=1 Tax=Rhizoctonia solani TaxID=456999 RepID=A0A8H3B3T0_9AGAM|nr:unnamed protein product [Rhizoctonia solani]